MPWYASLFLKLLGNAQIQMLGRKGLTALGVALLVKFGYDATAAASLLSQAIDSMGGLFALLYSGYLSAQKASPNIADPVLLKNLNADSQA